MSTACCLGERRGDVCAVRENCRTFWASEHPFPPTMRHSVCPVDRHGNRTLYEPIAITPAVCTPDRRHPDAAAPVSEQIAGVIVAVVMGVAFAAALVHGLCGGFQP